MSTIQAASAASVPAAAAGASNSAIDVQNRFLKLLITQMRNQDPLNPLDNAQITTQLAQINTVNGIEQLNTTMQNLASSLGAAQSTTLIGRGVLAEGDTLRLAAGGSAAGGVELAQAADSVKVSIIGPSGNVVRQLNLGALGAGIAGFRWDGLTDAGASAAAGTYTVQVSATKGTQKVAATPVVAGTVSGILLGTDGLRLNVDGVGDVRMQQIKSIM